MRVRFSLRHVAAAVLVVAMLLVVVRWKMNQPPNASDVSRTVNSHLRKVSNALNLHRAVNGSFPYDARGADFAVFQLKGRVDASGFDVVATGDNRARWNISESRLDGGEIHYHNVANPNSEHMIVLSTNTLPPFNTVHFCTVDGVVGYVKNNSGRELSLLGNYRSVDGLICASDNVYRIWCELHPQEAPGVIEVSDNRVEYGIGLTIELMFNEHGHVSRSRCRLGDLEVIENISTDRWGRIVAIKRHGQTEQLIATVAAKLASASQ